MAQDYEVREEYRSHSLSQLLDDEVLCFQGVGEIQAELLKQYFALATVRDLANWTQFIWSLEIQELALHGGDLAHTAIRQIVQTAPPKFQVRERGLDLTPEELMHASVADLDGLTPAQNLALYDIFRITNIAQLAHNRIMLEARVIQYLEGQTRAASDAESTTQAVDTVLGRPKLDAIAAAAAQRVTQGRATKRDEQLHAMETETRGHLEERLAAVRERARGRAAATAAAGGAAATAASAAAAAGTRRFDTLRATRGGAQSAAAGERVTAVASRRTTVAAGVGHERGALDESRSLRRAGAAGGPATRAARSSTVLAGRAAATGRTAATGPATGPAVSNRAASVLAARSGGAAGTRFGGGTGTGSYTGRTGGGGGGGGSAAAGTTAKPAPATAGAAAVTAAPAAATQTQPSASRSAPTILLAAAGVLVVAGGILFFALRSGTPPAPGSATQTAPAGTAPTVAGTAAPSGGAPGLAGTTAQTGSQPGAAGAARPGTTAQTGSQPGAARPGTTAGAAGTAAVPVQATAQGTAAPGVAKTLHTVREGQSLWRISKRYYQLGHDWPVIYKENQEQIDDPDLIYPKQQFRIPPKP